MKALLFVILGIVGIVVYKMVISTKSLPLLSPYDGTTPIVPYVLNSSQSKNYVSITTPKKGSTPLANACYKLAGYNDPAKYADAGDKRVAAVSAANKALATVNCGAIGLVEKGTKPVIKGTVAVGKAIGSGAKAAGKAVGKALKKIF